ncbi:MAG: RimK/LysX family protein [Nanoarchaeota archaeon]|nr:RimK/LysX family protein [Nanoarchaeota archaeon]
MKVKTVVGFYEDVYLNGRLVRAKIDTGAGVSSVDEDLAILLKLGPVIGEAKVISSHGSGYRPVVIANVIIAGRGIDAKFNVVSRKSLRYPLLIGKNILRKGFLIDSGKKLKKQRKKIIKNSRDLISVKL